MFKIFLKYLLCFFCYSNICYKFVASLLLDD